jgi:hypothetical protein
MAALHRLDCIHDLFAAEAECGSGTKRRACNGKLFDSGKSGLERIRIVCRFPFLAMTVIYTLMV